jgi:hypothetical protein
MLFVGSSRLVQVLGGRFSMFWPVIGTAILSLPPRNNKGQSKAKHAPEPNAALWPFESYVKGAAFQLVKAHFLPAAVGSSIISCFWGGWTTRDNCSSGCSRNDLSLLSEEYDPTAKRLIGNLTLPACALGIGHFSVLILGRYAICSDVSQSTQARMHLQIFGKIPISLPNR